MVARKLFLGCLLQRTSPAAEGYLFLVAGHAVSHLLWLAVC